jgi:hypothetical protein
MGAGSERSSDAQALDARRRLLLRGGLGAAPLVLSMASGPVIAGQAYTASAKASAPLSGTTRGLYTCNGKSPQSWCTKSGGQYVGWPCNAGTTQYHGSTSYQVWGTQCGTKLHKEVMNTYCGMNGYTKDTTALNKLAAHCAASVLNVNSNTVDARVLDKPKIQAIWDSCNATGTWSPTAGVNWTVDDVCNWMATTWT